MGVSLTSAADETDNSTNYITIFIHSAKGLEFDMFFLLGCQKTFNKVVEKTKKNIEEERRLAYVAITFSL